MGRKMRKKILVVSSYPAPYRVAVFQGLAQVHELEIFFEFNKDQDRNGEWFVKGQNFSVLDTDLSRKRFEECLRNIKSYDLVLAYDYLNQNARRAMRCCIRQNIPYFVNCDGAFINKNWLKDKIKKYYVSRAAACLASGEFARRYFLCYGARPERIFEHRFTSLNEEDIAPLVPNEKEREELRKKLGIEMPKAVLTVGQFIPRKGFDILLEAWTKLDSQAELIIIGGGGLKSQYQQFIQRNNLRHVKILDFMQKKELFEYYHAVDLFVLPTREDIWGLVINEAMACGLPVVSTNRCIAAMELIEDGKNGFVVPVDDPQKLSEAVKKLIADDGLCSRIRRNNILKMQNCTLDCIVKQHLEVIDKII